MGEAAVGRQADGFKTARYAKAFGTGDAVKGAMAHHGTFSYRKCRPWTAGKAPGQKPDTGGMACGGGLKPSYKD